MTLKKSQWHQKFWLDLATSCDWRVPAERLGQSVLPLLHVCKAPRCASAEQPLLLSWLCSRSGAGACPWQCQDISACHAHAGDGFSPRAEDAVLHGCLPVVVMDDVDPVFASILDWDSFSVRVPEVSTACSSKPSQQRRDTALPVCSYH